MKFNSQLLQCWKMKYKNKLKKKHKNRLKLTRVNPSNSWPESWDKDNIIENKLKQIMKHNSQSTQCFYDEITKKIN
jgi:hypothetical protein